MLTVGDVQPRVLVVGHGLLLQEQVEEEERILDQSRDLRVGEWTEIGLHRRLLVVDEIGLHHRLLVVDEIGLHCRLLVVDEIGLHRRLLIVGEIGLHRRLLVVGEIGLHRRLLVVDEIGLIITVVVMTVTGSESESKIEIGVLLPRVGRLRLLVGTDKVDLHLRISRDVMRPCMRGEGKMYVMEEEVDIGVEREIEDMKVVDRKSVV